jgi:hypothetical protein
VNDRLKLKMMRLAVPVTLVAAACATESKRNEQLKTTTAETGTAVEAGKICTIVATGRAKGEPRLEAVTVEGQPGG